jgi:hypothetical protein
LAVFLLLVVSCQATPPNEVPETALNSLEEQLHKKLNAFIGSDQDISVLATKNETVFMVDVETGYAYSSNGEFIQLNMYTEGPDGVMRNQSGQILNSALQQKSAMSQSRELSTQATQPVINFAPYRHVETKQAIWKGLVANVKLGRGYELEKLNEAAFNLLGIRAGAWTMEAGLYTNSYTWNPTYRKSDYWGAFANFLGPNGRKTFDYGILASPVPGHPVILYAEDENGSFTSNRAYKPGTLATMTLRIDAPQTCLGQFNYPCGYPKGSNTGYLVFAISGAPVYPQNSPNWNYKFIYDTSNVGFSTTFQGNLTSSSPGLDFSMAGAGWNFYRETTLVSIDKASLVGNYWHGTTLTSTTYQGWPIDGQNANGPSGQQRVITKNDAWAGKAPGIEQPDVTCPADHQWKEPDGNTYTYPFAYFPYASRFSQKVAGLKDGKQRLVTVTCYTNYYYRERTDISVGD